MGAVEPENALQARFDRDRTVVLYCASYDCPASTEAAKRLMRMGFTSVFDYKGGLEEWKRAGYPVFSRSMHRKCEVGSI